MNRRTFLRLSALAPLTAGPFATALAASAAKPLPTTIPGVAERPALSALKTVLLVEARQARDPWGICHGMLGAGTGLKLESGELAIDYLLEHFLRHETDGGLYFDVAGEGGLLGEQHPYLCLKKLIELKLHPELWKSLTDTGLSRFRMPESQTQWDDATWLLWAVAQQPGYTADTIVGPKRVRLGDVALGALARIELADQAVEAALTRFGEKDFVRPSSNDPAAKDTVWGFTCGGQHLFQSVVGCQAGGLLPESTRPRVEARLATLLRRVTGESSFRNTEKGKAMAAGVDAAVAEQQTALSLLKLNGHALESIGRARDAGFGKSLDLLAAARQAAERIEQSQLSFQLRVPLATYITGLRTKNPATWRLWLGDGCHTLHGFSYWT